MTRVSLSDSVRAAVAAALDEDRLVGVVVLVARDGKLIHQQAAGLSDREESRAMRPDAIFRLSSLTKPIVSAAAMALIERGVLGLDDAVTRWLPEFHPTLAAGKEAAITVRHLLTHTAGLTYGLLQQPEGTYHRARVSDGLAEPGLPMAEELARLASVPLVFEPGSRWGYSLAIDVLGEVLARAGGEPLHMLVERLVTGPLEMTDTAFLVRDVRRLATPYVDGSPPRRMRDPDTVPFGEGAGIRFSPSRIFDPNSFPSGGAGMAGTATDFLRFLETMRRGGGKILSAESTRTMMSNQIGELRIDVEETPSWGFGIGGAVLMDPVLAGVPQAAGTWKWGGVYGHHWYVDPAKGLTVVSLSNTAIEGMGGKFVSDLMAAIYASL
jgi:CubicO group peptidase (beta-lactamase class C family)